MSRVAHGILVFDRESPAGLAGLKLARQCRPEVDPIRSIRRIGRPFRQPHHDLPGQ